MKEFRRLSSLQNHLYWRPREVSLKLLVLIACVSVIGLHGVERFRIEKRQPYYTDKIDAATLAWQAMAAIKQERLKRGLPIDREVDRTESGMLGAMLTPVTTEMGSLVAKQTSVNPNFAAVVVALLKQAGARPGDVVAVGYSGSFPAINTCVLAAVQTLKLEPIIIASCGASQWGANEPDFLWIDMEKLLNDQGLIHFHSVAASVGGDDDRGVGMDPRGRARIIDEIHHLKLPFIDPRNYEQSVQMRMATYRDQAAGRRIRFYINVGGGASSLGRGAGRQDFPYGIVTQVPPGLMGQASVITHFLTQEDATVINLRDIRNMAIQWGLPVRPATLPEVGAGGVYSRLEYNRWLALGLLVFLIGITWALLRTTWGFRLTQSNHPTGGDVPPEPMI